MLNYQSKSDNTVFINNNLSVELLNSMTKLIKASFDNQLADGSANQHSAH